MTGVTSCSARNQTQGLMYARQALCHGAMLPASEMSFSTHVTKDGFCLLPSSGSVKDD